MSKSLRAKTAKILRKRSPVKPRDGATQDWSDVLKGATPEKVAVALMRPRKPLQRSRE